LAKDYPDKLNDLQGISISRVFGAKTKGSDLGPNT
jgi:hypothetical protein